MKVGPGHVVKTEWVPVHRVKLGNDARIAVGDVQVAYEKVLQNGAEVGSWPPPTGYWEEDEVDQVWFVICDGRHEYIARLMHGQRYIFVAWVEEIL